MVYKNYTFSKFKISRSKKDYSRAGIIATRLVFICSG